MKSRISLSVGMALLLASSVASAQTFQLTGLEFPARGLAGINGNTNNEAALYYTRNDATASNRAVVVRVEDTASLTSHCQATWNNTGLPSGHVIHGMPGVSGRIVWVMSIHPSTLAVALNWREHYGFYGAPSAACAATDPSWHQASAPNPGTVFSSAPEGEVFGNRQYVFYRNGNDKVGGFSKYFSTTTPVPDRAITAGYTILSMPAVMAYQNKLMVVVATEHTATGIRYFHRILFDPNTNTWDPSWTAIVLAPTGGGLYNGPLTAPVALGPLSGGGGTTSYVLAYASRIGMTNDGTVMAQMFNSSGTSSGWKDSVSDFSMFDPPSTPAVVTSYLANNMTIYVRGVPGVGVGDALYTVTSGLSTGTPTFPAFYNTYSPNTIP